MTTGAKKVTPLLYLAYYSFLLRYRRKFLGPLWILISPAIFIVVLGFLYAQLSAAPPEIFIPHLVIGFIVWTLIQGTVISATTIFHQNRAQILQGSQSLDDIILIGFITNALSFIHQLPIVFAILFIYDVNLGVGALQSLIGFGLLIINGVSFSHVLGCLGARYRDFSEAISSVMRVAFLATPIIWMPSDGLRDLGVGPFLNFNPFYHYLDVIRAPLLGNSPELLSWTFVCGSAVLGLSVSWSLRKNFARSVALWI